MTSGASLRHRFAMAGLQGGALAGLTLIAYFGFVRHHWLTAIGFIVIPLAGYLGGLASGAIQERRAQNRG